MQIELKGGFTVEVDKEDWDQLNLGQYSWYAKAQGDGRRYVIANVWQPEKRQHFGIRMHRLILNAGPGEYVDHIDGNGLRNVRSNLRLATNAQNQQNSNARKGSSCFKGVSWYARHGKWQVAFRWQGNGYFIGYFDDEIEAALAYNAAILPLVGEFARLNEIPA